MDAIKNRCGLRFIHRSNIVLGSGLKSCAFMCGAGFGVEDDFGDSVLVLGLLRWGLSMKP